MLSSCSRKPTIGAGRSIAVLICITIIFVAGCSTAGRTEPQDSLVTDRPGAVTTSLITADDAASASTSNDSLVATLRGKALKADEVSRLAVEAATSTCMAEAGFEFSAPPSDRIAVPPPRPWQPQTAESWLHAADDLITASATEPTVSTTPAYGQKLWGNQVGSWEAATENTIPFAGQALSGEVYDGCLPTAQIQIIGGGDPEYSFRVDDLLNMIEDVEWQALDALVADPEFARATDEWEACMEENGFQIYQQDGGSFSPAEPVKASEEDAAVRRYNECLNESDLTEIGDRLYPRFREQAEARLLGDGQEIEAELNAITQRANDALSS